MIAAGEGAWLSLGALLRCSRLGVAHRPPTFASFVASRRCASRLSQMARPVPLSSAKPAYEAAVTRLNALQSNAVTLQKIRKKRELLQEVNLIETARFLERCSISLDDVDKLKIIHVSGTKGKGSTCAFTESILRRLGYKTGFYSSPHLVHVRERIRINGEPLSEVAFAKYFFEVYDKLQQGHSAEDGLDMPAYFKFLTLMAFHVFISERVDVAVIEVGIGGEHDCTNVILNPVVCGITTLDFDHTSLLGTTLTQIAWQKAGIFKRGSVAIVSDQTEESMAVMRSRAVEKQCELRVAPPLDAYEWLSDRIECGIPGQHQYWNITLAMQLVKSWLERTDQHVALFGGNENAQPRESLSNGSMLPGFPVPVEFLDGLRLCEWPGRSQVLNRGRVTFFLDGAHTPKSLQCCAVWYLAERKRYNLKRKPFRVLLFHCTADRTPESLLPYLSNCEFDLALFCPTRLRVVLDIGSDQANYNQSEREQLLKVEQNHTVWKELTKGACAGEQFDCIQKAVERVAALRAEHKGRVEVLVTGSLHLVGGVLSLIEAGL